MAPMLAPGRERDHIRWSRIGGGATVGVVTELSKDVITCVLKLPVCADAGSRVTISRRLGTRFRLIGYGIIVD